jgi:hypothetical protein
MGNPASTLDGLTRTAAFQQLLISPQGLDKRFTKTAGEFTLAVLEQAIAKAIQADHPVPWALCQRFPAVYIEDSTQIGLPDELSSLWQGTGGGGESKLANQAALKVDLQYEVNRGEVRLTMLAGRHADNRSPLLDKAMKPGSLHIRDLGYFDLARMAEEAHRGEYWLSRLLSGTKVYTPDDKQETVDLVDELQRLDAKGISMAERHVLVGAEARLPARLIMVRLSAESSTRQRAAAKVKAAKKGRTPSERHLALCDWWLLITNAPETLLDKAEAPNLYGSRWQIELIFKLWKSQSLMAVSKSQNPWRILCEVYVKLLIVLVQHWIMLTGLWEIPQRSLTKGVQAIQEQASHLAACIGERRSLIKCLKQLAKLFSSSTACRQNKRKKKPNNWLRLQQVKGWEA